MEFSGNSWRCFLVNWLVEIDWISWELWYFLLDSRTINFPPQFFFLLKFFEISGNEKRMFTIISLLIGAFLDKLSIWIIELFAGID
jgi:hypothetical protein